MDKSQVGILSPGAGMSRLLHPLASRKRLLMAMASLIGEAQTADPRRGNCMVAGLLGTAEQWTRFEIEWKRFGIEVGAARTRMSEIESPGGRSLAALVNTCGLTAIGSHLAVAEFERLSLDIRRTLTGGRPAEPHVLCFRHCILEAARQAAQLSPEEKVSVVLDAQDRLGSEALWLFEEIRDLEPASVGKRLGALGFEPKQDFAPLRAAEWLALEFSAQVGNGEACLDLRGAVPDNGSQPLRVLFKSFDRHAFHMLRMDWEGRRGQWNQSIPWL